LFSDKIKKTVSKRASQKSIDDAGEKDLFEIVFWNEIDQTVTSIDLVQDLYNGDVQDKNIDLTP